MFTDLFTKGLPKGIIPKRVDRLLCHLLLIVQAGCLAPYEPPEIKNTPRHLVVDAFLNATDGTADVRLSQTIPLQEYGQPLVESEALVTLEDEAGHTFPLQEMESGYYRASGLVVNTALRYRLLIETRDARRFTSDYIQVEQTPPIERIHWRVGTDGGLDILVDSYDQTGKARFYRWEFEETWEYASKHVAGFRLQNEVVVELPFAESLYRCWNTLTSPQILVASTNDLRESRVSNFKMLTIPQDSYRLTVAYSMLVRQYALNEEAFNYWNDLKKNTETLGGLLDPLPSQVVGNIHAQQDGDVALGFFSGSTVEASRIFLTPSDLPDNFSTFSYPACEISTVYNNLLGGYPDGTLFLFPIYNNNAVIIGYLYSGESCSDCRAFGGTTSKPDFWN